MPATAIRGNEPSLNVNSTGNERESTTDTLPLQALLSGAVRVSYTPEHLSSGNAAPLALGMDVGEPLTLHEAAAATERFVAGLSDDLVDLDLGPDA